MARTGAQRRHRGALRASSRAGGGAAPPALEVRSGGAAAGRGPGVGHDVFERGDRGALRGLGDAPRASSTAGGSLPGTRGGRARRHGQRARGLRRRPASLGGQEGHARSAQPGTARVPGRQHAPGPLLRGGPDHGAADAPRRGARARAGPRRPGASVLHHGPGARPDPTPDLRARARGARRLDPGARRGRDRARVRDPGLRPQPRRDPPRRQAGQRDGGGVRRGVRDGLGPREAGGGDAGDRGGPGSGGSGRLHRSTRRLRPRHLRRPAHGDRRRRGHAGLHVTRAGARRRARAGRAHGRVLGGGAALLALDRRAPLRGGAPG